MIIQIGFYLRNIKLCIKELYPFRHKKWNTGKRNRTRGLRNLGDPEPFLRTYYNQKIDEIHFQDVVASLYGRDVLFNIIERISKKIFVNVSVGGGIKDEYEVDKLLRLE